MLSFALGDKINILKEEKHKLEQEAIQNKLKLLDSFARFVPKEFITLLNKESVELVQHGDSVTKEMTVLFADIRHFTSLSEQHTPEETFKLLNFYLEKTAPEIYEKGGFIDKFIGDSIMALFPNEPNNAVQAALSIKKIISEINHQTKNSFQMGFGIHTGQLIIGTLGAADRIDTTVIGDTVNLTSRIEGLTRAFGAELLVSEEVFSKIPVREYYWRELDLVVVKGRVKPVRVYEILDRKM